jgi:hypothetical protein
MTTRITPSIFTFTEFSAELPDYDLEVNRIFDLIMGQTQVAPQLLGDMSINKLKSIDPQEIKTMLIFDILRGFECLRKSGASVTNVSL